MFVDTLGKEDTRRPRMDMGLGVWSGATRRYYSMDLLKERHDALVDRLDGRTPTAQLRLVAAHAWDVLGALQAG